MQMAPALEPVLAPQVCALHGAGLEPVSGPHVCETLAHGWAHGGVHGWAPWSAPLHACRPLMGSCHAYLHLSLCQLQSSQTPLTAAASCLKRDFQLRSGAG